MSNLLQVKNISVGYDTNLILQNINFSVARGEFVGIIGPNGAGKTTLLRTINRLLTPKKGSILFKDSALSCLSLREIAQNISIVGQDISLSFSLTALELVLLGRFPYINRFAKETKKDLEIAYKSLELTDSLSLANRTFNHLSAGERQLIVLAKALAQQPQLLLLDEPTAHLDIGHQIKLFDLLLKLNQETQLTIVAVLHDLNLASEYCQKLILLDQGGIVSYDTPYKVLQYAAIEKAYGTVVLVKENPLTKKPYILPVPAKYRNNPI